MANNTVSAKDLDFIVLASHDDQLYKIKFNKQEKENLDRIIRIAVKGLYEIDKDKKDLNVFLSDEE